MLSPDWLVAQPQAGTVWERESRVAKQRKGGNNTNPQQTHHKPPQTTDPESMTMKTLAPLILLLLCFLSWAPRSGEATDHPLASTLFQISIYDIGCNTHTAQGYVGQNLTLSPFGVIQIGFWSQLPTYGERSAYKASPNEGALGFVMNWQPDNAGTYQSSWLNEDSNGCYWGAVIDDVASTGVQIAPMGSGACSWSLC